MDFGTERYGTELVRLKEWNSVINTERHGSELLQLTVWNSVDDTDTDFGSTIRK